MTGAKTWVVNITKLIGMNSRQVILILKGRLLFCSRKLGAVKITVTMSFEKGLRILKIRLQ